MDITLRMSDHALTARAAAAAGIVLLKNTAGTLPLLPAEDGAPLPVAVFGIRQLLTPAYDRAMTPWRAIGVLDGLMASDAVRPDGLLARKYRTWAMEHPDGSELPLTNVDFGALRHDCAAAVVVIGRTPEQDHTRLTSEETAMLTRVTSIFDRTILVLAAPGYIELNEAALACGAIVFLGLAGQEAGGALADVLTAKVMPSGHLSFTWPENAEAFDEACAAVDQFTGYRYFDSFGTPVRYPFGYGLGYGKIEFGSVSAGLDGCDVTVSAELVNTGETHAASELMQVYVTRPGDDLTRPVSFLQAFSKSRLLAPGESQTIRLRFPITDLAVYRESAHAFVLDAGYYDIRIGTSSRACYLAGSIRLTRSAVVQAAEPLSLPSVPERRRPEGVCFQYPEELAEIEQAHKHAIRFSDRALPRRSRKKGRPFTGCRGDNERYTLADVKEGRCSAFTFIAGMDDANLRKLVCDFGFCPTEIPGALGASAELPRYGLSPLTIASGVCGLALKKDIEQDDGTYRHQYTTGFPAPSVLSCSFDPDLIFSVGKAIGREMREYGVSFCLAPGCALQRTPFDAVSQESWSEDPVLTGRCALYFAKGVQVYEAAILRAGTLPRSLDLRLSSFRDIYGLPFEIAVSAYKAVLLPDSTVNGESLGEDSDLIRSLIIDWKFGGMFLSDGERYTKEPDRVTLERSALRIVRVLTQK